ncbi:MAG: ABC transporter substrate-binding protein, partial [Halorhabdus sp.]
SDPEKNNYDYHWEQYFRDPENVATTGAWTLESINGTQGVTLKPNEHHYAADQVNFDTIEVVARTSDRANRSALKADSQDYYRGTIPDYIAQSFPDTIEQRMTPNNGGLSFGFNHRYKLFENRKARQAIMYAIDRQRIAQSVHRTKYDPVTVPGGHGYRTAELVGQDWINSNLTTYERDIDKANTLMEEAGFNKEGGKWVDGEGNVLSIQIPTADTTPTLEPAFANQLSQFGIDASLQTYSQSVFSEKKDGGEFNIWPGGFGMGFARAVGAIWYYFGRLRMWAENWWRAYPQEQIEEVAWNNGGRPETNRPSTWRPYKIQAPPVGQPNGELRTYHPAETSMQFMEPRSQETYREQLKTLAWLYNWYMPLFPVANGQTQHFIDTAHWLWPDTDAPEWDGVGIDVHQPENVVSFGKFVHANPDNPESGASVDN